MAERELAIVIRAKDLASRAIAGVNKQLGSIGSHAARGMGNAARNIERGIVAVGATAVAGLGYALKAAGDFEAQMNTLNTIARATGDAFSGELGEIGDRLRKLARDTGTPLEELATAYYDLLSAGIDAANAQDVLVASNRLAIGGLASTAETVDLLTTAINSYGGDATKAAEYADMFAVAIERGKVTAAEIAASFSQVGSMAANMNIGIDQTSAILAQMTSKGVPAAEVFTMMRAAMVALQRQTPEMKRVLSELGIESVEAEVAQRGLVPVWEDLRAKADELGIPLIKLTGRVEGANFALMNTGENFESYNRHLEAVRKGTGTAQEQMEERQKGLNFQMARMRAILGDVAITLGSKLIPKVVPMLQRLAEFIEDNQRQISQFADDVARGFEDAVKWAMSLDWGAIANSLKTAAGFGRGIVEAFLAMPDWVKTAVITGWGLNKLTGGAVGSIVGELGKGLIKGILNMNAAVVNVNGRVVNAPGGGLGGGPAGGRPGGGGGGLLGLLTKGSLALLAAELASEFGDEIAGMGMDLHEEWGIADPPKWLTDFLDTPLIPPPLPAGAVPTGSVQPIDPTSLRPGGGRTGDGVVHVSETMSAEQLAELIRIRNVGATTATISAEQQSELQRHAGILDATRAKTATLPDTATLVGEFTRTREPLLPLPSIAAGIRDKAALQAQRQFDALAAVRGGNATLAQIRDKRTSITVPVSVAINQSFSVATMHNQLHELRTSIGGGGFI